MDLYLFRHGNTFQPGETATWVGSTNDMPLVEKGVQQAETAGEWLRGSGIQLDAVCCGPLIRTRTFADILLRETGLNKAVTIDSRLDELDYGDWCGLTDDEVCIRFGRAEFENWKHRGTWPEKGNWGQGPEVVFEQCLSFLREIAAKHPSHGSVAAVTSNGRLKYFAKVLAESFGVNLHGDLSVKTGNVCKVVFDKGTFSVFSWNQKP